MNQKFQQATNKTKNFVEPILKNSSKNLDLSDQAWENSVWLTDKTASESAFNKKNSKSATMDKYQAHRLPAKQHYAISVWLLNQAGEVLLQQRSQFKIVGAGQWGNAVCGNQRYKESPIYCAYRRLYQELGLGFENNWDERLDLKPAQFQQEKLAIYQKKIALKLEFLGEFSYKVACNDIYGEAEIDHLFVAVLSPQQISQIKINPQEVSQIKWVSAFQLLKNSTKLTLTPWTHLMLKENKASLKKLKKYLKS